MINYLIALFTIIIPILLVAGLGFFADRVRPMDAKTVSRLAVFVFSPALVYSSLSHSVVSADEAGRIALFCLAITVVLLVIGKIAAMGLRLSQLSESSFLLSITLMNAGNYGIPLHEFAYGKAGVDRAIIYFITSSIICNTLGVWLASRGRHSLTKSLRNVLGVPLPYAALLGLLANFGVFTLPENLDRVITLVGQGAVPMMLITLGVQLSRVVMNGNWRAILTAAGLRMFVTPAICFAMAPLIGVTGVSRGVSIIESSMPTAVMASVMAVEFDSESTLVSSVTLLTTLISPFTLALLLTILSG